MFFDLSKAFACKQINSLKYSGKDVIKETIKQNRLLNNIDLQFSLLCKETIKTIKFDNIPKTIFARSEAGARAAAGSIRRSPEATSRPPWTRDNILSVKKIS